MDKSAKQMVRELLTSLTLKPPTTWRCETCGAVMQNAMATFTFGDNESWTVPLPICVNCDWEYLRRRSSQSGAA